MVLRTVVPIGEAFSWMGTHKFIFLLRILEPPACRKLSIQPCPCCVDGIFFSLDYVIPLFSTDPKWWAARPCNLFKIMQTRSTMATTNIFIVRLHDQNLASLKGISLLLYFLLFRNLGRVPSETLLVPLYFYGLRYLLCDPCLVCISFSCFLR